MPPDAPATATNAPGAAWRLAGGATLALDRPRVIAIINATPDSFSDGGLHLDPGAASARAAEAVGEGADALDVGGESTRPGAEPVPAAEQIRRVVPVVERVRAAGIDAPVSVDTTSAEVARAALDAGADAINDVSGAEDDPGMLALAAERAAGLILMHRLRRPRDDRYSDRYDAEPDYAGSGGVVRAVGDRLRRLDRRATDAGVDPRSIVLDPGLGFGKSVADNLALLAGAPDLLAALGRPILCGASRKSFLGAVTGEREPSRRVSASVAVAVRQHLDGVRLFRVHDVREHRAALDAAAAIGPGTGPRGAGSGTE